MASESPWVVLAERLGYRIAEGIYVRSRLRYAMLIDHEETHSMLVGETLRVANETQGGDRRSWPNWKEIEWLRLQVTEKFENDTRATACIELLNAVGYPASS